jgi:dipeptidyl-peptidase-3
MLTHYPDRPPNHHARSVTINFVRALIIFLLAAATLGQAASPLVDRVRDTAIIQVEADSFNSLTPRQKALAYWLSQAAIAIDPIIYDQESRFGLRQRRLLEAVVSNKDKVDPPAGRGKSPRESIF